MISSSTLSVTTTASSVTDPNPRSDPSSPRKISPQLSRWSRARSIRSGRKLIQRPGIETIASPNSPVRFLEDSNSDIDVSSGMSDKDSASSYGDEGKSIYMISDGTGWTAEHAVGAALGQFDYCLVDRACPVNTHLFSRVDNVDRLMEIIKQAAKEGALVVYTLADPSMAESARQACELWGLQSNDILSPILEAIASHLGVSPSGLPRWAPGRPNALNEEYFRRIEAVEFTIKQDDGALPENLRKADIILTGVSRTSKTPLSIYLAQKGYKVANVPIVMNVELPKALFEVNPKKVFGLTINPVFLHQIRNSRAKSLSFTEELRNNYSEMDHVRAELEYAGRIFAENPIWPVIEVTGKAIEETAAVVLSLLQDRKKKCSMPSISKRY